VSLGQAGPIVLQPKLCLTVGNAWEAELLAAAGRQGRSAYLVAAHTRPHRCQFPSLEADQHVETSVGHLIVFPQEVVAVASSIPLDSVAGVTTQYETHISIHCSITFVYHF